jgi:hypothetical protein
MHNEGLREEGLSTPLIFLEPVDVSRQSYMFKQPRISYQSRPGARVTEGTFVRMIDGMFDEARESEINRGVKPFPRPFIDHKVLSTPRMRARFEALQQTYETVASCRCNQGESVWLQYDD